MIVASGAAPLLTPEVLLRKHLSHFGKTKDFVCSSIILSGLGRFPADVR